MVPRSLAFLVAAVVLAPLAPRGWCALDPTTMAQHLAHGVGILGNYTTDGALTDWLAVFDDSTPLNSLNIPGTHDSCAWHVSGLEAFILQTQDKSIFEQLNAGMRFFDLRFGSNNGTLQLYHSTFLLDPTATLEDVLWGFYKFLDDHPTETVILSLKVDSGNTDAPLQQAVFDMLTTPPVSDYWVLDAALGTLGAARHKAVLFRRYFFEDSAVPFGLNVSTGWTDNNADFAIAYDAAQPAALTLVEDLYQIDLANASIITDTKFAAVQAHLETARASGNASQLAVTFASGGGAPTNGTYVTPQILAVGDGGALEGINARMLPVLQAAYGARLGVVLFDYFATPAGLALATIGSSKVVPNATATTSSATPSGTGTSTQTPHSAARALMPAPAAAGMLGVLAGATLWV